MPLADQFKALIAEQLEADPVIVTSSARFVEDLGADSLDIIELTMTCEETFEITIPDEDIPSLTTVAKAQAYLECCVEQEHAGRGVNLATIEREPHSFLQLWKYEQAKYEIGLSTPLNHAASGQYQRIKVGVGDILWIVTVDSNGKLMLAGRLLIGELLNLKEAINRFGNNIYKAAFHVAAKTGTEELPRWVDIMDIAADLRFESKSGKTQLILNDSRVNGMQLQSMRLLTEGSKRLLEKRWYAGPLKGSTQDEGKLPNTFRRDRNKKRGKGVQATPDSSGLPPTVKVKTPKEVFAEVEAEEKGFSETNERVALGSGNFEIGVFEPDKINQAREYQVRQIVARRGQAQFRQKLIDVYEGHCAFTDYSGHYALEAAHIIPFCGSDSNHIANGLLLRSDIHTLFDQGLIAVDTSDPSKFTIVLAPALLNNSYKYLSGKEMRLPKTPALRPSIKALEWHRKLAGL